MGGVLVKRLQQWARGGGSDKGEAGAPGALSGAYFARISLAGFGFTALASGFTFFILPARIEDVAPAESKNTYLGVLSFVGLAIAVLVQPLAGALSDRVRFLWGRRRPFILGGTVASVPFLIAAGVAPSYALLFLFICLLQFSSNSALGPYQALIRDLVPSQRRGAASGMKWLVETAGAMGLMAVVGLLIGFYASGRNLVWIWASTGLLSVVLLAGAVVTSVSVREEVPPKTPGERQRGPAEPSGEAHPDFKWFLLSRFLIAIGGASLGTYAFFFLEDAVGIENPARALSILLPVIGITVLGVSYPAGLLADRIGRKPMIIAAGFVGGMTAVLLLAAQGMAAVIAIGVLAGIALGMFLGANWAMATDLVSERRAGQQMGYVNVAAAGGGGVARLNGFWIDRLNSGGSDLGYSVLFILCGILLVAGTFLILRVRSGELVERHDSPAARGEIA